MVVASSASLKKSLLLGHSSKSQFIDNLCEMLNRGCDVNRDIYFLGELNIHFLSSSCPVKKIRLFSL